MKQYQRNLSVKTLFPDFVSGSRAERISMNQVNVYAENIEKGNMPSAVPLAYQAIYLLDKKIQEAKEMTVSGSTKDSDAEDSIPIWKRYSLSIPEAARYFGIGEKRLYQIIAEHEGADFILEIGSHIRLKRELFSRYLDQACCV